MAADSPVLLSQRLQGHHGIVRDANGRSTSRHRPSSYGPCPLCGYNRNPDFDIDIREHRRVHRRFIATDQPKPDPELARLMDPDTGIAVINRESPNRLHRRLYEIAWRFQKEFGYDQVQWNKEACFCAEKEHGVFFCDEAGRPLGGCAFNWFQWEKVPEGCPTEGWCAIWGWVAPPFRRHGILGRAWPGLRERFPMAFVDTPISPAMRSFLNIHPVSMIHDGRYYFL